MGIRFTCPNGHKLNVKSHLAGKRGFCPECGAKVLIPLESTRPSAKQAKGTPSGVAPPPEETPTRETQPSADLLESEGPDATWYVQLPSEEQLGPATTDEMRTWISERRFDGEAFVWCDGWPDWREAKEVFPALAAPAATDKPTVMSEPAETQVQEEAAPSPPQTVEAEPVATEPAATKSAEEAPVAKPPSVGSLASDPLKENPDGVWYVQPPGERQFGPAKNDLMRQWIDEGRVSNDSLVWCEGWPEWREAKEVFGGLESSENEAAEPMPATAQGAAGPADVQVATADSLAKGKFYRRPNRRNTKLKLIVCGIVMLLVIVALIVAFVFVLTREPENDESSEAMRRDMSAPAATCCLADHRGLATADLVS